MATKCKLWKHCKNVPCGSSMNGCLPSYCVPGQSRNWGHCNMSNWPEPVYRQYIHLCKDESRCHLDKSSKVTQDTVDARVLHNKMPYIWRHLRPQTKKLMIKLANKPVKQINIPFDIFPDNINKKTRKQQLRKIKRSMNKNNRKLFTRLRKEYKNI